MTLIQTRQRIIALTFTQKKKSFNKFPCFLAVYTMGCHSHVQRRLFEYVMKLVVRTQSCHEHASRPKRGYLDISAYLLHMI